MQDVWSVVCILWLRVQISGRFPDFTTSTICVPIQWTCPFVAQLLVATPPTPVKSAVDCSLLTIDCTPYRVFANKCLSERVGTVQGARYEDRYVGCIYVVYWRKVGASLWRLVSRGVSSVAAMRGGGDGGGEGGCDVTQYRSLPRTAVLCGCYREPVRPLCWLDDCYYRNGLFYERFLKGNTVVSCAYFNVSCLICITVVWYVMKSCYTNFRGDNLR